MKIPRRRRYWRWIIIIALLTAYALVVGSWWVQGNINEQRYYNNAYGNTTK